jgi:hypothetical protein
MSAPLRSRPIASSIPYPESFNDGAMARVSRDEHAPLANGEGAVRGDDHARVHDHFASLWGRGLRRNYGADRDATETYVSAFHVPFLSHNAGTGIVVAKQAPSQDSHASRGGVSLAKNAPCLSVQNQWRQAYGS